jgi:putative ATPase
LFAKSSDVALRELNAMDAGISDLRAVFDEAKGLLSLTGRLVVVLPAF